MASFLHYAGHIISSDDSGRFPKSNLKNVQNAIEDVLNKCQSAKVYGSLAAGADILFAESFVKQGAELHIVLPFDKERFIELSVINSGKQWLEKFNQLLDKASSLTQIYHIDGLNNEANAGFNEELSFALCTEIAIGLGLAQMTMDETNSIQASQLTLWDRQLTNGIAGTYPDMLRMQAAGFESKSINSQQPFDVQSFNFVVQNE